jgi:hypothetical protein
LWHRDACFARRYVQRKGICAESEYPYTAMQGLCNEDQCEPVMAIDGFKDVAPDNETALMRGASRCRFSRLTVRPGRSCAAHLLPWSLRP